MSEINENLEIEELSTEDKKKAINLQDLVYVKKYIDDRHYDKIEVDKKFDELSSNTYSRTETDEKINDAIEASTKSYTKEESDETFYKKTDTVDKANEADSALMIYDQQSGTYKKVRVIDESLYDESTADSNTFYFIKE